MKNVSKSVTAAKEAAVRRPAAKKAPEKETVLAAPAVKAVEAKEEKAAVKAAENEVKAAENAVKAEAPKEAAEKTVAKKAPVKKPVVKETVYLQYLGKEIDKEDLVKEVKNIWTKELKKKAADLKSITLYLKPEENAAYYVINEETTGKIEL